MCCMSTVLGQDVPAHDTRDFQFAKAQLPIQVVIAPTAHHAIEAIAPQEAYTEPGIQH